MDTGAGSSSRISIMSSEEGGGGVGLEILGGVRRSVTLGAAGDSSPFEGEDASSIA